MTTLTSRLRPLAVALGTSILIAACGGGGGGGGGSSASNPVRPFTGWSAVTSNSTVEPPGVSHVFELGQSSGVVTSVNGTGSTDENSSTLALSFRSTRALQAIEFSTPTSTATFNHVPVVGNEISCQSGICAATDAAGSQLALLTDPNAGLFEYQTFGTWLIDRGSSATAGAMSAGLMTQGSAIPTVGTGTYNGAALGFYSDASGQPHQLTAQMSASYDFGARLIVLSTSNTQLVNLNTLAISSNVTGLDVTGNLSYASATNQITGTLTSQNAQLSGSANARFFGPNADEIGGIFALRGAGVEAMNGAFGGKR